MSGQSNKKTFIHAGIFMYALVALVLITAVVQGYTVDGHSDNTAVAADETEIHQPQESTQQEGLPADITLDEGSYLIHLMSMFSEDYVFAAPYYHLEVGDGMCAWMDANPNTNGPRTAVANMSFDYSLTENDTWIYLETAGFYLCPEYEALVLENSPRW